MSPFLQLTFALAMIIALAKLGSYLSFRLGHPAVLGELLVGVLLGPSILDFLHLSIFTDQHLQEVIQELAELGVMLLMFLAGLELHISELLKSSKVAILAGVLGVLFPLALGAGGGVLFALTPKNALFLGLTLAATSVSISAQTLIELNRLRSKIGFGLLGAAVFDDILVVLGLSVFTALAMPELGERSGFTMILIVLLRMVIFLFLSSAIGYFLFPPMALKIFSLEISQGLISFVFVTILLFGWLADVLGKMAAITGAFLAGLWFARTALKERILSGISTIAYGVFVPIFFVDVGLNANVRSLFGGDFWLFLGLFLIAVVGKVLGVALGALLSGDYSPLEALELGVGMMSRGEVGLIVASVGISEGFLTAASFSAIVGVVVATTLLTPPLLRYLVQREPGRARVFAEGE
ncbi:MAG: cation:proton antiporter [Anaerolineales bacterium]|nr:cation:proton antiporter [Anaerolineales bacterium]MCS7247629.1 cation:proton antiporter [Anaerolineales bacterium]MDW8161439.1 cation:proton antiporter [Anaerolineales bacterium]MDW8446570.1 cation:proton antiporter [Anaerolineales bacterium]